MSAGLDRKILKWIEHMERIFEEHVTEKEYQLGVEGRRARDRHCIKSLDGKTL